MGRTCVVTGAASGIGAATVARLQSTGARVISCDLHDAEVIADLATSEGRAALAERVAAASGGKVDAIIANAGGGPAETTLQLNFFGAVATLERLRPLLAGSPAPRAVAVSSISSLRSPPPNLVELCLAEDEAAAVAEAWRAYRAGELGGTGSSLAPDDAEVSLALYGAAKRALQLWCRRAAVTPEWGGAGIPLNVVALGFYDTPAAAYILADPQRREAARPMFPLAGAYPGRPDEAAALLAWCVDPANSQMTGQVLYADAGAECLARGGQAT
jgi:NAD(P)-dependent dehydrogenase (short-subunit alcohol dehydrogenase family)